MENVKTIDIPFKDGEKQIEIFNVLAHVPAIARLGHAEAVSLEFHPSL